MTSASSPTARLAAGLVALAAWAGLAIQFGATHGQGYDLASTAWILLRFFTVLTNLAVAMTMSAIAFGVRVRPSIIGGVMLAILLVGVVYITLLRGLLELSGGALLADTILHKVTPVLVPLWWLAFARKGTLKWRDPAVWSLFPLAYFPYALARGSYEGIYAYPFINVVKLGWTQVAVNAVAIATAFLVAGFAIVALDRALGRRQARR